MSDNGSIIPFGPPTPEYDIRRLRESGEIRRLRRLLRLALDHIGCDHDAVHQFLATELGLTVASLPGGAGRVLAWINPGEPTFGLTAEGDRCGPADI